MRVSWLIPVRDGARWLGEAVRSALADSLPTDEVVVVDDGSRDDPASVLPDDPRIHLLRQPALGIVAALEHGRSAARGELLARLDCDDLVLPGRLAAQRAMFAADPKVAAVGGMARPISDDGVIPAPMQRYVDWVNSLEDPHRELLVESPMFHPATTLRASALAAIGGYRHGAFPEDYDLFLRLVTAGFRLHNLRREVLAWRDRPGRLTHSDPRYSAAATVPIKRAWLLAGPLAVQRRVAVLGAGEVFDAWRSWLRECGHEVGSPIEAAELLFVIGGTVEAREGLRRQIRAQRADLLEGHGFFFLG